MTTLADLCASVDYGYTAKSTPDPEVGPKYLRITDIVPPFIDWSNVPHCVVEPAKQEKFLLREGDIVVARSGSVGFAKQVWERPEGTTFASYLVRFRPDPDKVEPRFLGQIVQSEYFRSWVRSVAGGVAQPNANANVLGSFEIDLPERDVQRKVAGALGALDAKVDNNRRRIQALEEMARLIYREWFVHFRFPGHEGGGLVDSDLGLIPQGWDAVPLSDLVTTQYGYTESAQDDPVGPRYLRGMDMNKTSYIDWSTVPFCPISVKDREKFKIAAGDVFVIRMADPGKVSICEREVDAVFASYLVRLKPKSDQLTPYYLFFTLSDDRYQGWVTGASTGSTRKSVSAKVMTEPSIVLPPVELQRQFVETVGPMRQLLATLLDQNAVLTNARDLLLPRLISGELDVSDLELDLESVA